MTLSLSVLLTTGVKMTSDKTFTHEEFVLNVKKLAQAMANKVVGSRVELNNDPLGRGIMVTISQGGRNQTSLFTRDRNGHVTMTNILGDWRA